MRNELTVLLLVSVVLVAGCASTSTQGTGGTPSSTTPPPVTTPPPASAPTVSLSASPTTIEFNQPFTLTWQTTDATTVSITDLGVVQPSGSMQVVPARTTTYILTATGPGGTKQTSVAVTVNQPTPPTPPPTPTVSLSALATHNSASDCWVAYNGKVYDITAYLPVHPGGAGQITPYCGMADAFLAAFTNQHGTSQVSRLESLPFKGNLA